MTFEVIFYYHYLLTWQEAHCQKQWLGHSAHFSSSFYPVGCCQGTPDCSPSDQAVARWEKWRQTKRQFCGMDGRHAGMSHSCPFVANSQNVIIILKFAYKPHFRRLIKTCFLFWLELFNHFQARDSRCVPTSLYHAKEQWLLVNVILSSWPVFFTLTIFYFLGKL